MLHPSPTAQAPALEFLGDPHPLLQQLGSLDGLVTLAGATACLQLPPIASPADLRSFLQNYHARILAPLELPAIRSAFAHAGQNELRELIALDQRLAQEPVLQLFTAPSWRVGQAQLQKLRPLRDQRFVQRYLAAVDASDAHGWHTLVYGLTLAVYSLPLRQGLLGYAHQTMRGFIYAAAPSLHLSREDSQTLFDELSAGFPAAVESLLAPVAVV